MLLALVLALVTDTSTKELAAKAAVQALHSFGVHDSGKLRSIEHQDDHWNISLDRPHNVFTVTLSEALKVRGIGWSSTSMAYRQPEGWLLRDRKLARAYLDRLAKKIPCRFPVKWQQYAIPQVSTAKLAFRASAVQRFTANGHPFLYPWKGVALSVSPRDGEIRSLEIRDDIPPLGIGTATVDASQARIAAQLALKLKEVRYVQYDLGYYQEHKGEATRLVWRLLRQLPIQTGSVKKSPMTQVADYVDAVRGTYWFTKTRFDNEEYWPTGTS